MALVGNGKHYMQGVKHVTAEEEDPSNRRPSTHLLCRHNKEGAWSVTQRRSTLSASLMTSRACSPPSLMTSHACSRATE